MTLITLAVALLCERLLSNLRRWREYDWFGRYLQRLRSVSVFEPAWKSPWGLLLLLPPLVVVMWLQAVLQGGALSLLGFLFSIFILIFAIGPRDLWEEVRALIHARENADLAQAHRIAADLATFAGRRPRHAEGQSLVRSVLIQGNERLFGILLWFFVLGPAGAVLYRMASELPSQLRVLGANNELLETALRLHGLLAWVPVRIVGLLYGIAGSTDGALKAWRALPVPGTATWVERGWQLLAAVGLGALGVHSDADHARLHMGLNNTLREALGLVTRGLFILLATLAAFTIVGWIA